MEFASLATPDRTTSTLFGNRPIIAAANKLLSVGRKSLPHSGRVVLHLERLGDAVRALCSADGREWFGVDETLLPADGPTLVGLHAIGQIDRILWPGAYPQGTAIRFGA